MRVKRFGRASAIGMSLLLVSAGAVWADHADGDFAAGGKSANVTAGEAFTLNADLYIVRQGTAAAAVSWSGPTVQAGTCAGITGTPNPTGFTMPDPAWKGADGGTKSSAFDATKKSSITISGTAGSAGDACTLRYTGSATTAASDSGTAIPPGNSRVDFVVNFVAPATTNAPPVADAGGPYSGDEGEAIDIDGSASSDTDGDPLTYKWTYTLGTAAVGTVCIFDDDQVAETTVTCSDNGTVNLHLEVDDGEDSDTDTATLTLANVAPTKEGTSFSFDPYTGVANASVDFEDVGWTDVVTATWSGITGTGTNPQGPRAGGGTDPLIGTLTASQTYSGCITNAISVQVSDDDSGSFSHQFAAANTLGTYAVEWMAPVQEGARNIVKHNNVIPLKITITDSCTGERVTDRDLQIRLRTGLDDPELADEGNSEASESVSKADTGNFMRVVDSRYQYNLATKGLSLTTPYTIIIRDVTGGLSWSDGLVVTRAVIDVKK